MREVVILTKDSASRKKIPIFSQNAYGTPLKKPKPSLNKNAITTLQ
jgi:hypothetical protein